MENVMEVVTGQLYDFKQLEEIAPGNKEFFTALAQLYLDTIPQNSNEMVEAAKVGDWLLVSKLAHKLKSTVDSMNIQSISKDIRTLEFDGKNKVNTNALPGLSIKVNAVILKVAEQIKLEFNL